MQDIASPRPRFDSMAAWTAARQMVGANRDMLLAIGGVFFLLPSLVISLAVTPPQLPDGATSEELWPILREFYVGLLPWAVPAMVLSMAGTLALQLIMTDPARPTVGQAIRRGFALTPSFLAAQLLFGLSLGAALGIASAIAALTGIAALVLVVTFAGIAAMIHFAMRFILIAPVLAEEGERNPVRLLQRSWALTRGQVGRLLLFVILLVLVFSIVTGLISGVISAILAFTVPAQVQKVLDAAIASGFSAVGLVYFAAIQVAAYRQLSGR